jgi:AbrB family transcriptional regulator (stage V sporulation protein T)
MKATGIVRRIDDLGRVVIPKEIRRTMRIREGDPLEIYTDRDGTVIFKKYSQIGELSTFASQYSEVLSKTGGLPVVVCDRNQVVAVSGMPKKDALEKKITPEFDDLLSQRKVFSKTKKEQEYIKPIEGVDRFIVASSPIMSLGDIAGCIMYVSGDNQSIANESQIKLIQAAAAFLGMQME